MNQWWHHLSGKPFYWALDGTHPAADLFMLRHVVERPLNAPVVRAARLVLVESPEVVHMKARLRDPGGALWEPRYESALWVLRLLAELGVPGDEEVIAETLDRLLDQEGGGAGTPINSNAILLQMALAFGFFEDERVEARLLRLQRELAEAPPPLLPEERVDWLLLAALALAEQPPEGRDPVSLARLASHLSRLEFPLPQRHAQYGFPIFDQPDELALARAALQLGLEGEWLQGIVERVVAAQDEQGLWRLQRLLPTPVEMAGVVVGQPSRWITAQALYVLRAFYGE